jgi:hypothetical protein
MRDGQCCQHPPLVPPTFGRGGGVAAGDVTPTPTKDSATQRTGRYAQGGMPLAAWAGMIPTPTKASADKEVTGSSKGRTLVGFAKGAIPTPTKTDAAERAYQVSGGRKFPTLVGYARGTMGMWPTIVKGDARSAGVNQHSSTLGRAVRRAEGTDGGQLNPLWVAWLMGWPIGSTASKHWATAKSRSARQQHGPSSEEGES